MHITVRVQDVEDIWSYRRAIYVEIDGKKYAAAYDGLGNCLGGSCDDVARILATIKNSKCKKLVAKTLTDWADEFFSERIVEYVYHC